MSELQQICNCGPESVNVVSKQAQTAIARATQKTSNSACLIVVVNMQEFYFILNGSAFSANCTLIPLFLEKAMILWKRKTIFVFQLAFARMGFDLFGIILSPFCVGGSPLSRIAFLTFTPASMSAPPIPVKCAGCLPLSTAGTSLQHTRSVS